MFSWVWWAAFNAGYIPLVKLPLKLLEAIIYLFQLIALELPQYLMFGVRFGQKFSEANLPFMFLRLAIISILVFAILFITSGIRIHFQKQGEENALSIAMKNSLTGTLWIIAIPILLFLGKIIFNVILSLLLGNNSDDISKTIFMSLKNPENEKIKATDWNKIANNNFSFDQDVFDKLETGEGILLIILGGLTTIMTLIPFILGALTLVQKIYQQFFLFIISPFICAASVSDNGKRLKTWIESYAAKSLAIGGMIIGLQLYSVFIIRSTRWVGILGEVNFFAKILLILAIVAGGAIAVNGITSEATAYIGESASVRETIGETKNLMKTGMALAGGVGAVAAIASRMGNASMGVKGFSRNRRNDKIQHAKKKYRSGQISRSEYKDTIADAKREHNESKMSLADAKQERKEMQQNYQHNAMITHKKNKDLYSEEDRQQAKEQNLGKSGSDFWAPSPVLALEQSWAGFRTSRLMKKQEKLVKKNRDLSSDQYKKLEKHKARFAHLESVLDNKTKGLPTFSTTALNRYGGNKRVKEATNTRQVDPKFNKEDRNRNKRIGK
ncbi:hypothetical protein NX779_03015 [Mycoplasma cottewii]|uniref:Uncharacterized protein n=1 Tax=Mycoplasma cottewii TaxID=51364 RepID=A0ABY5TYY0_9MOLU|nr:hypothetical protein [Mycoplasma cottewii]UWD34761.1 hypothetical protein NX779_03015 [Mycoplasma cottewii]